MKSLLVFVIFLFTTSVFAILNPLATPSSAAVWGDSRASWDATVLQVVRQEMSSFNQARDVENFCPGYRSASQGLKETCWLRLVSALVKHENSAYNPSLVFPEPSGPASVGLMMLSRGECPNAPTETALKDAKANLACGVKKMAQLIKKGGCIGCRAGAAAYWSTLRAPYIYSFRNSQGKLITYRLGKQQEIIAKTQSYASFGAASPSSGGMLPTIQTAQLHPPVVEPQSIDSDSSLDGLWMDFSEVAF